MSMIKKSTSKSSKYLIKEWVDYSDQSEQENQEKQDSQPQALHQKSNKAQPHQNNHKKGQHFIDIDKELDKLDQLDSRRIDEVWLLFQSSDLKYLHKEAAKIKEMAHKKGNFIKIYPSRQSESFEVLTFIQKAYSIFQKGYDKFGTMKVSVQKRNFENKKEERQHNNDHRQKKDKFNDKKDNYKTDKKKYIDKETGKEFQPKKPEEKTEKEIDSHLYSKDEAVKKGKELGNFRNKDKKEKQLDELSNDSADFKKKQGQKAIDVAQELSKKPKKQKKEKPKAETKKVGIKTSNRFELFSQDQ